jgi:hypothetical protein
LIIFSAFDNSTDCTQILQSVLEGGWKDIQHFGIYKANKLSHVVKTWGEWSWIPKTLKSKNCLVHYIFMNVFDLEI